MCFVHGGNAKQVKAKREQRVLVAEARAAAAVERVVLERREPEELLIDLLDDVNRILQQIKSELDGNVVSPALLQAAGEWFDRTARVAKTVIDGDLSQKLHACIGWLAQDRAQQMWGMLAATLKAAEGLTAADRLLLWNSVAAAARLIADEREPLRLSGDEVHRVTAELQTAAAREREAAEGITWGEDPSQSGSDSVSGELVLFPGHGLRG